MDLGPRWRGREENKLHQHRYTIRCRCIAAEKLLCSTGSPVCCSVMSWGVGMREVRVAKEGRDVCIIMADLYGRNQYNIVNFFKYLN